MNEMSVQLPEPIYEALLIKAQAQGQTPADWIASKVEEPDTTTRNGRGQLPPKHAGKTLLEIIEEIGTVEFGLPDLAERDEYYLKQIMLDKAEYKSDTSH